MICSCCGNLSYYGNYTGSYYGNYFYGSYYGFRCQVCQNMDTLGDQIDYQQDVLEEWLLDLGVW